MIRLAFFFAALFLRQTSANHPSSDPIIETLYQFNNNPINTPAIKEPFDPINFNTTQLNPQTHRQLQPSKSKSPKLSPRSQSWLTSHNTRRKSYHAQFKASYIPLQWSDTLASDAYKYATKLAQSCHSSNGPNLSHGNSGYGENLAYTHGKAPPSTESILTKWVEGEEKLSYPKNGHYTQVLWRATEFVGCADVGVAVRGKTRKIRRTLRRKRPGKRGKAGGRNRPGGSIRPKNNKRPGKRPNHRPGKRPNKKPRPNVNNNQPGRTPTHEAKVAKNDKGGKRGKNGKENGSKTDKEDATEGGSFQCHIQVCRYARYVFFPIDLLVFYDARIFS